MDEVNGLFAASVIIGVLIIALIGIAANQLTLIKKDMEKIVDYLKSAAIARGEEEEEESTPSGSLMKQMSLLNSGKITEEQYQAFLEESAKNQSE